MPKIHITRYNHPSQNWLDAILQLRAEFDMAGKADTFTHFILSRLEDETMLLILAWDGETPVGYGLTFDVESDPAKPEWERTGYISQFLVSEQYRQTGVGTLLMQEIDQWFLSQGLTKVLLNVDIGNAEGQRFWQRQGFEPYAVRMRRVKE